MFIKRIGDLADFLVGRDFAAQGDLGANIPLPGTRTQLLELAATS